MPASTFTPDAGVRPGGGYLQSLATSPTYRAGPMDEVDQKGVRLVMHACNESLFFLPGRPLLLTARHDTREGEACARRFDDHIACRRCPILGRVFFFSRTR